MPSLKPEQRSRPLSRPWRAPAGAYRPPRNPNVSGGSVGRHAGSPCRDAPTPEGRCRKRRAGGMIRRERFRRKKRSRQALRRGRGGREGEGGRADWAPPSPSAAMNSSSARARAENGRSARAPFTPPSSLALTRSAAATSARSVTGCAAARRRGGAEARQHSAEAHQHSAEARQRSAEACHRSTEACQRSADAERRPSAHAAEQEPLLLAAAAKAHLAGAPPLCSRLTASSPRASS